jgi:hypothetical protein
MQRLRDSMPHLAQRSSVGVLFYECRCMPDRLEQSAQRHVVPTEISCADHLAIRVHLTRHRAAHRAHAGRIKARLREQRARLAMKPLDECRR